MNKRRVTPTVVGPICCDVCMKVVLFGIVGLILWRNFFATQALPQKKFFQVDVKQEEQFSPINKIQECLELDCLLGLAQLALSTRVCGSPAVDGYAHVNASCLEESPSNKWWHKYIELGGKQEDMRAVIEEAADFDGLAVAWGIGNKVNSAQECAQQCVEHQIFPVAQGPFSKMPCNAFAWCSEDVCFEPDAHSHSKGDCWLKFSEGPANPEINMRGDLPEEYRQRHPSAPLRVQWVAGVLLPQNVQIQNGTWGPRWYW